MTAIYMITCKSNNKIYIGSSINISKRWKEHINDLKSNRHRSKYLQNCYNKYGEDSLKFEVIHECISDKKEDILRDEQFYIDTLNPEFNTLKIAGSSLGYKPTEESRKKMSEAQKGKKHSEEHIQKRANACKKPIIQYSLDNVFIKEWMSIKDAGINLGIHEYSIGQCCKGKRKTAGGFKWKYKN